MEQSRKGRRIRKNRTLQIVKRGENMYIIDGIAYAGDPKPMLKAVAVRALADWKLWLKFNDDSIKIYDFKKMLDYPAFKPLKDIELFNTCYVDFGTVEWCDGKIDISVEELYNNGVDVKNHATKN